MALVGHARTGKAQFKRGGSFTVAIFRTLVLGSAVSFALAVAPSNAFRRLTSLTFMPPYLAIHLEVLALLTLFLLHGRKRRPELCSTLTGSRH
jgi:hypothetical protein